MEWHYKRNISKTEMNHFLLDTNTSSYCLKWAKAKTANICENSGYIDFERGQTGVKYLLHNYWLCNFEEIMQFHWASVLSYGKKA